MAAPEQRTPKQDRSRITRERLLGASIDLLATQGWAAQGFHIKILAKINANPVPKSFSVHKKLSNLATNIFII